VVTDEDRDQRARRILDEARALLERRVEPYVPPPLTAAISLRARAMVSVLVPLASRP
jgi:hypothetical protein